MICKRVNYKGHVQGVGFRYTCKALAENFTVRGFVRNLANGSVELVAEGSESEVDSFLQDIAKHMEDYIHGCQISQEPPKNFVGFVIRT